MLQIIAVVSGRVQHVGYRSRVVTMARTLDLKGYVRNLADGRVQAIGPARQVMRNAVVTKCGVSARTARFSRFLPESGPPGKEPAHT